MRYLYRLRIIRHFHSGQTLIYTLETYILETYTLKVRMTLPVPGYLGYNVYFA